MPDSASTWHVDLEPLFKATTPVNDAVCAAHDGWTIEVDSGAVWLLEIEAGDV